MSILIKNEMKRNVITIGPEDTVRHAAKTLASKGVGCCVVVTGENAPVGILTERDILNRVVVHGLDPSKTEVRNVMTPRIVTIGSGKTVQEAVDLLAEKGIKRLPIMERGKLVGIITMTDLLWAMRRIEEEQNSKLRSLCEDFKRDEIRGQERILHLERQLEKAREGRS